MARTIYAHNFHIVHYPYIPIYVDLMTVKCSLITGQTKLSKSQSNYFYAMVEAYNRTNDVIFSMLVPLYLKISFVKCCRTKWQKCTVMYFFTQHLASLEWFKTHDLMICFSPQQQAVAAEVVIVICDLEAWFFNSASSPTFFSHCAALFRFNILFAFIILMKILWPIWSCDCFLLKKNFTDSLCNRFSKHFLVLALVNR